MKWSRARFNYAPPLRWVWRSLTLVVAFCAGPVSAQTSAAPLSALLTRSAELGVARSLAWRRLLHYRPDAFGHPVSQIDGKAFFLAPTGATDPEAELTATLRAFFQPLRPGHEDEHALCRFPARRRLLDEALHFERALASPVCPALARYLAVLDPQSITVVYSANYLNNPASAFGHTFLRLKKRKTQASAGAEGLDQSVEYTADSNTHNPFLYAFKGLTGLFPGYFRFHSFASKVHEYGDSEARDLWEYDLSLSDAEVSRLTLHLWELSVIHLDYYYLTKNCSYHVLATLEAAAPRIDLVDHLNFVVLPRDTIKALFTVPGLVRASHYRPSLRSQFRAQVARLGAAQQSAVQSLSLDPNAPLPREFTLAERVAVLDAAVVVLDARFARSPEAPSDARVESAHRALLARRAALSITLPLPAPGPPPNDKAPQRAHGSMRVSLGSGITSQFGSAFETLGYRLALHDLSDPPDGEPELSQLQFLDTRLRYDLGERAFTLEQLTFAELVALNPLTRFEHALSWRGRAFGVRLHDRGCRDCFAHGLELGIGATLATEDEHLAIFAMADTYVAFSPSLNGVDGSFVRLGVGPFGGARLRVSRDLIALVTANWAYLPGASARGTFDVRATLRASLGNDVAVGLEGALQPESSELQLGSYLYF